MHLFSESYWSMCSNKKEGVKGTVNHQHRRNVKGILEVIPKEYLQVISYNRFENNQSKFK